MGVLEADVQRMANVATSPRTLKGGLAIRYDVPLIRRTNFGLVVFRDVQLRLVHWLRRSTFMEARISFTIRLTDRVSVSGP